MSSLPGKRVVVVGLGRSGDAAARALLTEGARVRVTDAGSSPELAARADEVRRAGAEVELGGHDLGRLDADLAVVSPGIPPTAPVIAALRREGVTIWSEVELAYRLARCDFLAVTGTNGKTTVTSLLAAMLAEAGVPSVAAGNIGLPLVEAVAAIPPRGAVAVEVSSFQLAAIERFRPRVAVLLNIAEDHTDWHGSPKAYAAAKARIVVNQQSNDVFVPNHDDPVVMQIAAQTRARVAPFSGSRAPPGGAGIDGDDLVWRGDAFAGVADIPLAGRAGREDAVAAAAAALEYGLEPGTVRRALKAFRPLPHRLETVAEIDGITYIDDSKATNPHATLAAVRGLRDVVLILGGRAKGIDLRPLAAAVPRAVAVVALGEAKDEIARIFEGVVPVATVENMEQAVAEARHRARRGGSVLLSPGCASLDMYDGYAARGDDFARCVRALLQGPEKQGPEKRA